MQEPDFSSEIGYERIVQQRFVDASNIIESAYDDFMYRFHGAHTVAPEEFLEILVAAHDTNDALERAEMLNHDYSMDLDGVVRTLRRKCNCINHIKGEFSGDKRQVA